MLLLIKRIYANGFVLFVTAGQVIKSLVVLVMMSLHLSEISEASATDVTLDSKVVTVFLFMLFKITFVRRAVLTLVTFVHHSGMVLGMTD